MFFKGRMNESNMKHSNSKNLLIYLLAAMRLVMSRLRLLAIF